MVKGQLKRGKVPTSPLNLRRGFWTSPRSGGGSGSLESPTPTGTLGGELPSTEPRCVVFLSPPPEDAGGSSMPSAIISRPWLSIGWQVKPSALKLGGEIHEVTVMFADLSGFTALSGRVEPEVLTHVTNRYLTYIVEQVEATGGYVDKFTGDAVMAIWGAPVTDSRHAVNGIRAAMATVARIRQEREAAGARGEISFSVKIGLNSGPAIVGNVGTDKRYNYTAVGETVNLASRLEGVPSVYGCQIVVGQHTAELAGEEYLMRELDTIQVKGREAPLTVFEPIVERAKASQEQMDRVQRYLEALGYYRSMWFAEASQIWEALSRKEHGSLVLQGGKGESPGNPPARMAERACSFAAHWPLSPWNGVCVLTGK